MSTPRAFQTPLTYVVAPTLASFRDWVKRNGKQLGACVFVTKAEDLEAFRPRTDVLVETPGSHSRDDYNLIARAAARAQSKAA